MSPALSVETVRAADLAALHAPWSELVRATGVDPLCNSPDWVLRHARAYSDPGALFGVCVRSGDEVIGLLVLRPEPSRGRFALPRAIFAADGTYESDYTEVLVQPGREAEVMALILDELARTRGLQAVVLAGVPEDSPRLAALRAELERRKWPVRESAEPCLIADLPGSFDEFLAGRRSRMRTKIRSALRKVDERDGRFAWCDQPDELNDHLEGLFRLHQARWAEVGGTGSFADERRKAFYFELVPAALASGELRLARVEIEGTPVAYQFGLQVGSTYYQVQEGYDPAFGKQRVGVALRAWVVRELIEAGVARYDFMAGDSSHKRDWGGVVRPCSTVAFALPRLRSRAAYAAAAWADRARAMREKRSGSS